MIKSNYEKSWSGTTRTIKFGPHICDLCLWIDALLFSLWETKIFRKLQTEALWCPESIQSSAICDRFWLLPVALIQWNEWSKISVYVVKGPQIVKKWHQIDDSSLLQKCQFCMLAMYKGQYHAEKVQLCKIGVWDHSDLQFWTPYMWSMPLDRCSPVFSGRDKIFRKSRIEALWCPKSVQRSVICDRSYIGCIMNAMGLAVRN